MEAPGRRVTWQRPGIQAGGAAGCQKEAPHALQGRATHGSEGRDAHEAHVHDQLAASFDGRLQHPQSGAMLLHKPSQRPLLPGASRPKCGCEPLPTGRPKAVLWGGAEGCARRRLPRNLAPKPTLCLAARPQPHLPCAGQHRRRQLLGHRHQGLGDLHSLRAAALHLGVVEGPQQPWQVPALRAKAKRSATSAPTGSNSRRRAMGTCAMALKRREAAARLQKTPPEAPPVAWARCQTAWPLWAQPGKRLSELFPP